uniref:RxLR effector candidate protein n=1 Tax=Hyaloperonospora arabidopsidis (strain Emoy2) TaxID=559515 RepID=M4B7L5_HYAAE
MKLSTFTSIAPWMASPVVNLVLCSIPSVRGEPITDTVVTRLGDAWATLTHSHPAFEGWQRYAAVDSIKPTASSGLMTARHLEPERSDVARLEAFFGTTMESNYNVLNDLYPRAVSDELPWSGDNWPTYKDGINAVWKANEPSPAQKYASAFNLHVDTFLSSLSLSNGVLSESSSSSSCRTDADCVTAQDNDNDDRRCGLRANTSSGYCIPAWHGLGHARAAAALLEDEPQCDVSKNNVTFHAVDIKALLTQLYDDAAITIVLTGARFNGPDAPEELDRYGRYTDAARRDVNAGFFHMAMTNILGKHRQSFIVDVSANAQVWNEPVQAFEILEASVVNASMLSLEHFDSDTYPFNDAATFLAKCTTRLTRTVESMDDGGELTSTERIKVHTVYEDYEYCLELDGNYTIIGGEWLGASRKNHPDFLWLPTGKPRQDTVTATGISYANVLELLKESRQCEHTTGTLPVEETPSISTQRPKCDNSWVHDKKRPANAVASQTPIVTSELNETYPPATDMPATYALGTSVPSTPSSKSLQSDSSTKQWNEPLSWDMSTLSQWYRHLADTTLWW